MANGRQLARRVARLLLAFLGLALSYAAFPPLQDEALAQELIRRRSIFDLFLPQRAPPPQPQRVAPQQPSVHQSVAPPARQQQAAPAATPASPPPPPAVEKLDDARVVLVVGDFMASGLAEGLEAAYAKSPGVRIVNRSNGSSGFVRDDFYDWNTEIKTILEEEKPAVVVVMIGSNDRQQLLVDGEPQPVQSDAWLSEYADRVLAFAQTIVDTDVPVVWTGLPPFSSSSMSSDMLAFNDIYKQAVEQVNGAFVDIWDGFVDENGAFAYTGPDMNGQPVRLRGSGGINLTGPGKRKVAFYVERPLNRILGPAVTPGIEQIEIDHLPAVGIGPEQDDRTRPISLVGHDLDGGLELLGAEETDEENGGDPLSSTPQPGRADDFSFARDGEEEEAADVSP